MNIWKVIILGGVVMVLIGVIGYFAGDKLSWIGKLPGDIDIRRGNTRIVIPITTMLLFSILLSLVLWLLRRF